MGQAQVDVEWREDEHKVTWRTQTDPPPTSSLISTFRTFRVCSEEARLRPFLSWESKQNPPHSWQGHP